MTAVAEAPATGPLAPSDHLPLAALVGTTQDLADWIVYVALSGRYAVTRRSGAEREWWRYAGGRWHRCDERLVRAAAQYAVDDAYRRVVTAEVGTAHKVDRLLDPEWVGSALWHHVMRAAHVPAERLGLR